MKKIIIVHKIQEQLKLGKDKNRQATMKHFSLKIDKRNFYIELLKSVPSKLLDNLVLLNNKCLQGCDSRSD